MKRLLRSLDVDLRLEHAGHHASVSGSRGNFVIKFPTLLSLFHFLRVLWPSRRRVPEGCNFQVEWKGFRFPPNR